MYDPAKTGADPGEVRSGIALTLTQRLSRTLLVFATTAGATFTVLIAGGSGTLDVGAIRLVYVLMAAVALVPWLAIAVVRPSWRPSSRLAPALATCVAVFAISTVTSRFPRLSIEMLGYAILLSEVYLLLVALMRRPALRLHLERLALLLSVVVSVLYLAQVFQAWLTWWGLVGHLAIPPLRPAYLGLFISPNPIATIVMTFGAFGLAASGLASRTSRAIAAVIGVLILVTTLITGSRGAWLGAGLGVIAVVGAYLLSESGHRARVRALVRTRAALAALAVGTPVVAVAGVLAALSGRLTLDDSGFRAGFARASLRMFEASPVSGVGPGTWATLRPANTSSPDPDLYIPHAHNIYLQTLAEFGLFGVLGGVVLVVGLGLLIFRAVRSQDAARRRVGYAALFGVAILAGQQVADMLMNVPAVLLAIALPIAWLDATSQSPVEGEAARSASEPRAWTRAVPLVAGLATIAIIAGLLRVEAIAGVASQGVSEADLGHWQEATRLSAQAVADDPDVNVYRFQLGISAANAGDLELAEQSLTISTAADDYRYAWLDLAAVRWRLGDLAGARDALDHAERLGLQRTALAIAAGWLRQQLGDQSQSTTDYAAGLAQLPTLADDPFWTSPSGPSRGLAPILAAITPTATPATLLQLDLVLGELDRAREEVKALAPSDPAVYPLVIPAWQGDAAAWSALQKEAARRPLDPGPATWSRLIAAHLGDATLAGSYGRWLSISNFPDSALPVIGRIVFNATEQLPRYILDGYGTLYRRPVPAAQVVDLLPQVVLQDHP